MRAIYLYLLPIFFLNQEVFGNEGSKWINSNLSALENAADSGDVYAQAFLALCFIHGDKGLTINHTDARFFAESASSRGHWLGNFALGYLSEHPLHRSTNRKAEKLFLKSFRDPNGDLIKSAASDDPIAQYVLAEIFTSEQLSPIVQTDLSMALEYYELSAASNYFPATLQCALIKIYGMVNDLVGDEKSMKEGIKQLKIAADSGLPSAHHYLGRCYIEGIGVEIDLAMALIHLQAAADRGYGASQLVVADFFAYGHGCPLDLERALSYAKLADTQLLPGAREKVEEIEQLLRPEDSIKDNARENYLEETPVALSKQPIVSPAVEPSTQSIDKKDSTLNQLSSFRLPSAYQNPNKLESGEEKILPSEFQASERQTESFEDADFIEMREEAKRLYWGKQGDEGLRRAVKLFSVAADLGDGESARYLGIMHLKGKGVARDSQKAYDWLEIASDRGDVLAQKNLQALRKIIKR